MPVRLNGTTGYTELSAPAVAGNNTLTLPTGNGTARQILMGDGSGTLSFVNDAGALFYRLNADLAGANNTTAQNIFGVGVTLAASTVYALDMYFILSKTAGATSHTISLGFAGTATTNNLLYGGAVNAATGPFASGFFGTAANFDSNTTSLTVASGAISSSNSHYHTLLKGTVSINAGGTFIPQYSLSAVPGGAYSTLTGSYIRFVPIGTAGSNSSQGTWS